MKNPLTLEERASVARLITHDPVEQLEAIYYGATGMEKLGSSTYFHLYNHVKSVLASVTILATYNDDCYFQETGKSDVTFVGDVLNGVHTKHRKGKLSFSVSEEVRGSFGSHRPLIYTALNNLAKNGMGEKREHEVNITVAPFLGNVPNIIYLPDGGCLRGAFVRFNVHDNGPGFPSGVPVKDFFELGASTKGEGHCFGLYYVSLVCKFLRAPLSIESKPGSTDVAIYHPLSLQ